MNAFNTHQFIQHDAKTYHVILEECNVTQYSSKSQQLCSAFDMLAIEKHVSTEHLRSSSVSNVIKAVKAVKAFLTFHYLARSTKANVTKRLLRKIESRERLANSWYVNTLIARALGLA